MGTRTRPAALFAAALALALLGPVAAQSVTSIPLDLPGEDDGAFTAAFSASGAEVLIGHLSSGTITRLDIATATVVDTVDIGSSVTILALDEAGSRLLAVDDVEDQLHVLDPGTLALLSSIPLGSISGISDLLVDDGVNRALIVGRPNMAVVDLGTSPQTLLVDLPQGVPTPEVTRRVVLSPSGTHATVFTEQATSGRLETIDLGTGAITQTLQLPSQRYMSLVASPDRSCFALTTRRTSPAQGVVLRYETASLALLSTTRINGVTNLILSGLRDDGSRAVGQAGTLALAFPATDATLDVGGPGVTRIQTGGAFGQSPNGDLSKLAYAESPSEITVADLGTGTISRAPRSRALFPFKSFWSRQGDRVGELNPFDRISVSRTAGGLVPLVEANTGFGLQFDSLAALELSEDYGRAFAIATDSDLGVWVELESGSLSTPIQLPGKPMATGQTRNGQMVLSLDRGPQLGGALIVFDPATPSTSAPIPWAGLGIEFAPAKDPGRIWMRSRQSGPDQLVLIDVAAQTILASIPLTASPFPARLEPSASRQTIAMDEARGQAFVCHPGLFTVDMVDLVNGQVQATIPIPPSIAPGAERLTIAVSPDGSRLYSATGAPFVHAYQLTAPGFPLLWSRSIINDLGSFFGPTLHTSGDVVFTDLYAPASPVSGGGPGFVALDGATGQILDAVDVGPVAGFEIQGDDVLLNLGTAFGLTRFDGSSFSPPELHPMTSGAAVETVLWDENGKGLAAGSQGAFGGTHSIEVLDLFAGRTQTACTGGTPNATGMQTMLTVSGSPYAGGVLEVRATGLAPNGMFGLLVLGDQLTAPNPIPGSRGSLCLGGLLGRFNGQVQTADASGAQSFAVNTQNLPTAAGPAMVSPGTSWTFQTWHRDTLPTGGATSNTSTAVQVTFR